jgi:hypothetical protein
MNGIFANYLWTTVLGKRKYRCIRVYDWFKDDKHVIWMWIWLILKNISLLDRIWSLWLVRFAHSPTNFIFWLGRLIFSVSINSHPDNIYTSPWTVFELTTLVVIDTDCTGSRKPNYHTITTRTAPINHKWKNILPQEENCIAT